MIRLLPAFALGCWLSVGACTTQEPADTGAEDMGEVTDGDQADQPADASVTSTTSYQREDGSWAEGSPPTTVDNGPPSDARKHDRDGYVIDSGTNFVRASMGPSGMDALNIYLQDLHQRTGHDVHIYFTNASSGPDAEGAMGHADGIIFIRPATRSVTVIGEGISDTEGEAIGSAMIAAFDERDFVDGFVAAIRATGEAMTE